MTDPGAMMPPQSKTAEQQVLAAVFRLAEERDDIFAQVRAEDFYFDAHQRVFAAAAALHHAGHHPDPATVGEELSRSGQLAEVGGAVYLAELWEANPTGLGWQFHAGRVTETATRRRLIRECQQTLRDAYDPVGPTADLLSDHERRVFALGDESGGGSEPAPLADALADAMYDLNERLAGRGTAGVKTGFERLDNVLGSFRKGELTVVAARPSVGKSAIALNFSLHALDQVPVLFFSQEMSRLELAQRVLAFRARVPLHAVTGAKEPTGEEVAKLIAAQREATACELFIDDRPHLSAAEVIRATRRAVRRRRVGLVVVDYLQRMNHDRAAGETTTRQVGDTAKQMKTLARLCDVPVICLAQLNREVEGRGDGKPKLSDLRDSGEIEQEADNVLLLHPHPRDHRDPSRQVIDVIVAKQRNGPVTEVPLVYHRPYTRFEDAPFAT